MRRQPSRLACCFPRVLPILMVMASAQVPEWSETILPALPPSFEHRVQRMRDPSVKPCDNFFQHACGAWIDHFKLPKHRSSWTYGFDAIDHRVTVKLDGIIHGRQGKLPAELSQKLEAYQRSCTNTEVHKPLKLLRVLTLLLPQLLNQIGIKPLRRLVETYTTDINDAGSFMAQMAKLKAEHGDV